jgi:hypothetical protein
MRFSKSTYGLAQACLQLYAAQCCSHLSGFRIWVRSRGASSAARLSKHKMWNRIVLTYGRKAWPANDFVPGWDVRLPATSQQEGLEPSIEFKAAYKVVEHILMQGLPVAVLQVRPQLQCVSQYDMQRELATAVHSDVCTFCMMRSCTSSLMHQMLHDAVSDCGT